MPFRQADNSEVRQADNSEVRQADNSEVQDSVRRQKFRIPATVRSSGPRLPSEVQDSGGSKEQDEHDHRHDVLDHDPVEVLQAELPAAVLDFLDDPVGADDPADQDRGQHGDEGHHEAVADVVHQVQELADTAVGQRELHIELAVAQCDDDRCGRVEERQRDRGGLSFRVEDLHAVGCDGLQDRDAAGQRRKSSHQEEGQAHEPAQGRHRGKDLGERDEHQARARLHAFHALEDEDRGDDHHARQERHARVKKFNLVYGCVDIDVFFNIGTVGDHDSHGDAQREEDLAHGVQQDLQEALEGQPLEIRSEVDRETLQAGACRTGVIRVREREREDRDRHDHDQHYGHQYFGTLLDSLLDAVEDNPGREQHEDRGVQRGLARGCDEIREETVLRGRAALAGHVRDDVARDPAADDGVVGHDQHRDQKSEDPEELPLGTHLGVGVDGILAGPAPDRDVAGQQREAESEGQDQIDQNKEAAAVFGCQVGEAPEIADADRAAGRRHDEADLAGEAVLFMSVRMVAR